MNKFPGYLLMSSCSNCIQLGDKISSVCNICIKLLLALFIPCKVLEIAPRFILDFTYLICKSE